MQFARLPTTNNLAHTEFPRKLFKALGAVRVPIFITGFRPSGGGKEIFPSHWARTGSAMVLFTQGEFK
jgi:hypothetical protein